MFSAATLAATLVAKFGPVLLRLRPLTARLPALPAAGTLAIVGVLASVAWIAYGLFADWRDQRQHAGIRASAVAETTTAIENATLRAANVALKRALADRDLTLLMRDLDLAHLAEQLDHFETQQQEARNASPNPDTIVIPAGDPWLVLHRPFGVAGPTGSVRQGGAAADPLRRTSGR